MKKTLTKQTLDLYHFVNNRRVAIDPKYTSTFPVGIRGDLSGIRGDLSGISGDLTEIYGDLTGVYGDLTDCEITEEDRKRGIDIKELIQNV